MSDAGVFPYPGSKSQLASWIISHLPTHRVYVEPFAGSVSVLVNKDPSPVEIVNDIDGDIVQFFETLRDHPDELIEWLESTPFSRELHERYASEFYTDGYRPDDDVERAGRWFYLRNTQFAQKYTGISGFRMATARNHSRQYHNRVQSLDDIRDRVNHAQIEQLDYAELVDRTDDADVCYYFDPPYLDVDGSLYTGHDGFDHERFVDTLADIDGDWLVSYTTLPDGLADISETVVKKDKRNTMRAGQGDWSKDDTERLVMNYDPDDRPQHAGSVQSGFGAYGGEADE